MANSILPSATAIRMSAEAASRDAPIAKKSEWEDTAMLIARIAASVLIPLASFVLLPAPIALAVTGVVVLANVIDCFCRCISEDESIGGTATIAPRPVSPLTGGPAATVAPRHGAQTLYRPWQPVIGTPTVHATTLPSPVVYVHGRPEATLVGPATAHMPHVPVGSGHLRATSETVEPPAVAVSPLTRSASASREMLLPGSALSATLPPRPTREPSDMSTQHVRVGSSASRDTMSTLTSVSPPTPPAVRVPGGFGAGGGHLDRPQPPRSAAPASAPARIDLSNEQPGGSTLWRIAQAERRRSADSGAAASGTHVGVGSRKPAEE